MADLTGMLFPLLILLVFYFFMIRPQAKKQKAQQRFVQNLKKGDEVVTQSGIIGRISKIEDGIVTLQVGQKDFLRVLRGTISKEMTDLLAQSGKGHVGKA